MKEFDYELDYKSIDFTIEDRDWETLFSGHV